MDIIRPAMGFMAQRTSGAAVCRACRGPCPGYTLRSRKAARRSAGDAPGAVVWAEGGAAPRCSHVIGSPHSSPQ